MSIIALDRQHFQTIVVSKRYFKTYIATQNVHPHLMKYIKSSEFKIGSKSTTRGWLLLNYYLIELVKADIVLTSDVIKIIEMFANDHLSKTQADSFIKFLRNELL